MEHTATHLSSTARSGRLAARGLILAAFFLVAAGIASGLAPTVEIAWVVALLVFTVYLFVSEVVGVDVAAITVMVVLGLTSFLAPVMGLGQGLVSTDRLFSGFSSNAVISIIAVMIIGAGLDRTGVMTRVAAFILRVGGTAEARIIPIISGTVGFISSFMQNVGAAALFLPVVSRISARTGLPLSRLLMPMGFCAILGGTVTMVGSSPLILLNDLILNSNQALPPEQHMQTWSLFAVTPVGLALLAAGIAYFVLAGRFVLPSAPVAGASAEDAEEYLRRTYGLQYHLVEVAVHSGNALIGRTLDEVEREARVRVVAVLRGAGDLRIGPSGFDRNLIIEMGYVLGVTGSPESVQKFVERYGLEAREQLETFADVLVPTRAGIGELVIPPRSVLIGRSARDLAMRQTYGATLLALHRAGQTLREGEGIRDIPLQAGDTLIVHITWEALARLQKDRNFVVVTTEYPHEELRPRKVGYALMFFGVALTLVLFTDLRLSVALLTGALGMVLSGVLSIEEAYRAVSWKTVFLLASLIPLGLAVETSGTAAWIATQTLAVLGGVPIWILQLAIAVLATFFTLVMSNVGATVLLVPLAVNIAVDAGGDPAVFALTVAIATSNSFLIPTHQVNALIMGPAGYRVADFVRAGGIMTVVFLCVMLTMMSLVF